MRNIFYKLTNLKNRKDYILIILVFFIFNLIIGSKVKTIGIIPDEINTIAIPALLSGHHWDLINRYYYGWSGAVFYYPVFIMIKNPVYIYKVIVLINSILLSFIPCISYYMLKHFFKIENRKLRLLISFFLGVYPGTFSMAQYVWNENWVRLVLWVILLYIFKLFFDENNRKKNNIILGFLLAYGYSVHGRMIAMILIVATIYLYSIKIYKKKFINLKFLILGFLPMFIVDAVVKKQIKLIFWNAGKGTYLKNTFSDTATQVFSGIGSLKKIIYLLRAMSSYTYYMNIMCFGLLFLGIILFIRILKEREKNNIELKILGVFLFSGILFSEIITSLYFINDFFKSENYFIFGRYTDQFISIIIFFVTIVVIKKGIKIDYIFETIGLFLVHSIIFLIIESREIRLEKVMIDVNILPLIAFPADYVYNNPEEFYGVILFLIIVSIYIVVAMKKNLKLSLLIGILLYSSMNINIGYHRRRKSRIGYSLLENEYKPLNIIANNFKKAQLNLNFITNNDVLPAFYLLLLKNYYVSEQEQVIKKRIELNKENISLVNNYRETIMLDKNMYRVETNNEKDSSYNLYYKGKDIKKLLDSKNIGSKKYDAYLVPFEKLLTTKDNNIMQNNIIFPKTSMYGPYIELRPNKYQVIITGKNLDKNTELKLTCKKENQENSEMINYKNILKNNNQYIVEFEIKKFITRFETVLANNSNNEINIKSVQIIAK